MAITLLANDGAFSGSGWARHRAVKDKLKQYRLCGVEISLNDIRLPVNDFYQPLLQKHFAGFDCVSFHLPYLDVEVGSRKTLVSKSSTFMLKSYMELLSPFKAAYLNMHVATDAYEDEVDVNLAIANLKELRQFAEDHGTTLTVENTRRGLTAVPAVFKEIIVKSGVRATLDIGHARGSDWVVSGRGDQSEFIAGIEDRLLTAHIYAIEDETGHNPITDVAEIDPLLRSLYESNCQYWVIEHSCEEHLAVSLQAVRNWLDAVDQSQVKGKEEAT